MHPIPSHALSVAERAQLLEVANEPRFAAVPPARIAPTLADEGVYLASESSFARVLHQYGQNARRGRAKPPKAVRPPTTHIATTVRQVWCWDMTYLPAAVLGRWFHLYLILDLYSSKIVGWEVHDTDDSDHAAHLVRRTALAEGIAMMAAKPVLHGDNGSTFKATTVLAMLNWLGVKPSYSRPRATTTTLMPSRCFAPLTTGPSSRPRASPRSMRPAPGPPASCVGTTSCIATAAFDTSRRRSAMPAKTRKFLRPGMTCTPGLVHSTQLAGPARLETVRPSAP